MNTRILGASLMVAGTSIGGGMLTLPTMAAKMGYSLTLCAFVVYWGIMYLSARNMMTCTLASPQKSHFLSMSFQSLGFWGMCITGIIYLALLLCLNAVYLNGLTQVFHLDQAQPLLGLTFIALLFSLIMIIGYRCIDWANRGLMILMVASFILLALILTSVFDPKNLIAQNLSLSSAISYPCLQLMITSLGYQIIIPSIAQYVQYQRKALHQSILIGSCITLLVYIIWISLVMAYIPQDTILSWDHQIITHLIEAMPRFAALSSIFSTTAIATSFLGVTLCLLDFTTDGLKRLNIPRAYLALIINIPAIIMVYFGFQFINGLAIAGSFVAMLLILLPAVLAWQHTSKHINTLLIAFALWVAFNSVSGGLL